MADEPLPITFKTNKRLMRKCLQVEDKETVKKYVLSYNAIWLFRYCT